MGRPEFDENAYDSAGGESSGTSIENAYFGAHPAESSTGVLFHGDTNIRNVFGTRVEDADGTP